MSEDLDKMTRITHLVKVFNEDAFAEMSPHPDNMRAMATATLHKIDRIIDEGKPNLDIVNPTASEVKQMISELRDEMNKEFEKVRAAARLHLQNYNHSGGGGSF